MRDTDKSWETLTARAAAERPQPAIDVSLAVRKQIESEPSRRPAAVSGGILNDLTDLLHGVRGIPLLGGATSATLLLVWQMMPAIREVALAIELQSQLLTGL